MVITEKSGGKIGCTIRLQNGLWAAWDRHKKIGEYMTQGEAANAVFRAPKRSCVVMRALDLFLRRGVAMKLLDGCCGAGGAGHGYKLAGFDEIVGSISLISRVTLDASSRPTSSR